MRWVATVALTVLVSVQPVLAQDEAPSDTGEETAAVEETPPADEAPPADTEVPADTATTDMETADPAPVQPTPETAPEDTSSLERIIVTGVAGAVAVAGLAVGITMGVMASGEYDCLKDVTACNADRDEPIEGEAYLDAKANVERTALYADMGYLVAATAAVVAIVGAVELLFGAGSEATE